MGDPLEELLPCNLRCQTRPLFAYNGHTYSCPARYRDDIRAHYAKVKEAHVHAVMRAAILETTLDELEMTPMGSTRWRQ